MWGCGRSCKLYPAKDLECCPEGRGQPMKEFHPWDRGRNALGGEGRQSWRGDDSLSGDTMTGSARQWYQGWEDVNWFERYWSGKTGHMEVVREKAKDGRHLGTCCSLRGQELLEKPGREAELGLDALSQTLYLHTQFGLIHFFSSVVPV